MKGVSAIIAIVLLLVITISMAGFFYLWMQGSLFTTQASGTQQLEKTQESMSSCIKLESSSGSKIYVRNCGVGEIKNTSLSIYVDNTPVKYSLPGNITEKSVGEITLLSDIEPGSHGLKISGVGMGIDESADICTINC
jgi:flagellin-like protein